MSTDVPDIARLLVEQTADAIIFADGEGRIRIWNAAVEVLFGFRAPKRLGRAST